MVSLRSSLINIWSLLSGQVVSSTSCLRLTDYFAVAVCEFARSHRSASFKPALACCSFILWFLQRDLDKRHHMWTRCARNLIREDYGLFCSLNNVTWDKRGKKPEHFMSDGSLSVIPFLTKKQQHMLYWSARSQRTTCCLLSGSIFSRDIFSSTIADINDGKVINLMILFNNHLMSHLWPQHPVCYSVIRSHSTLGANLWGEIKTFLFHPLSRSGLYLQRCFRDLTDVYFLPGLIKCLPWAKPKLNTIFPQTLPDTTAACTAHIKCMFQWRRRAERHGLWKYWI